MKSITFLLYLRNIFDFICYIKIGSKVYYLSSLKIYIVSMYSYIFIKCSFALNYTLQRLSNIEIGIVILIYLYK